MGAAMEWLAAHVGCRLAGDSEGQQHLSFQRALADGVVSIVGEPDRVVGRHEHAMRAGKEPFSK